VTDADLLRRILGAMRPDIPMDWHDQAWLAAKGLATLEAIEAEAATPAPHLADCGYDEPHEPHTYVLAENDRPVDHECPGLAATPAPLDVDAPDNANAATTSANATPAPLDVHTDLLLLIAECLVPLAFAASPDGGRRQSRLAAIAAAYAEETE